MVWLLWLLRAVNHNSRLDFFYSYRNNQMVENSRYSVCSPIFENRMKIPLILSGLTFLVMQCSPTDKKSSLIGSWKVDSIYTYYNGFAFTRKDIEDEPLLDYQSDGRLKMTKGKESRFFLFDMADQDTLFHRNLDHEVFEKFLIQEVNGNQLILRKEMQPVFRGNSQVRYEIRYLSKF